MIRGTTPIHIFTLSVDASTLKAIRVIYAQDDDVLFVKELPDITIDGAKIKLKLTQEETFKFNDHKYVQIQIRALTEDDDVVSTPIMTTTVEKCLDNEVMM